MIEKTTAGNAAEATKNFEFKIRITPENNNGNGKAGTYTINGTSTDIFCNTDTTFSLKGGEKAEFTIKKAGASFTVEETSADQDGYKTSVTATGATVNQNKTVNGTFNGNAAITVNYTNSKYETDLDIFKVDANGMTKPLSGAQFTLKELDPNGNGNYLTVGGEVPTMVSSETMVHDPLQDGDGIAKIAAIKDGYYEISETKIPAGYVLVDNGKFYVKVVDGVAMRIRVTENDSGTEDIDESLVKNWAEDTSSNGLITFTAASVNSNAKFTVGNSSGTQLPQTGGIGTGLYTALGGLMTATAGAILTMKSWRRRKQNA